MAWATGKKRRRLSLSLAVFFVQIFVIFLYNIHLVMGGTYTSSAHGNSTTGVNRNTGLLTGGPYPVPTPYAVGHCGHCHEQHASIEGVEPPPTGDTQNPYALFKENYGIDKNRLCYACHETFTLGGQPLGYGRYGVYQGSSKYDVSIHNTDTTAMRWPDGSRPGPNYLDGGNCNNCHNPHGYNDGSLIPSMLFKRIDKDANDYTNGTLCDICHDGSPVTRNVKTIFSRTYKHPTYTTYGKHSLPETTSASFSGINRHVECTDCHNAHLATAANPLKGASGIDPAAASAGATPASYTFVFSVTDPDLEYKICFKCHSSWAGYGTGTDQSVEFNTANDSFHFVEKDKYTYTVNTGTGKGIWKDAQFNHNSIGGKTYVEWMMPRDDLGWTSGNYTDANLRTLSLRCSDCHGPDALTSTTPNGPHGSNKAKILKYPSGSLYTTWGSTATQANAWCLNCHIPTFANTGLWGGGKNLHTYHFGKGAGQGGRCLDCHQANPHGSLGSGTANQRKHLLSPSIFREAVDGVTSGAWPQHGSWVITSCT